MSSGISSRPGSELPYGGAAMRIAVYAHHCTSAGNRAWTHEVDERWDSDDIEVFSGTVDELRAEAVSIDERARTASAGIDIYLMRVAATLREATE